MSIISWILLLVSRTRDNVMEEKSYQQGGTGSMVSKLPDALGPADLSLFSFLFLFPLILDLNFGLGRKKGVGERL
jgi:hypothetical protein